MVTVAPEQHQSQHPDQDVQDGGVRQSTGDYRGVTIRDIGEDSGVDNPSEPSTDASSSFHGECKDYVADALCAKSSITDVQTLDEIVSQGSSTQYSDVDSIEGDESGSWSNEQNSTALEQHFDNGVALPISEVPTFGEIRVKNSANVHFGNKTFYHGPVTIKQIVYANPTVSENGSNEDFINFPRDKVPRGVSDFAKDGSARASGRNVSKQADDGTTQEDHKVTQFCAWLLTWRCVALMSAMGSCLVASVVVSVVLLSRESRPSLGPVSPDVPVIAALPLGNVRFITRNEWGAQPPTEQLDKLQHPVPYVIISHTATEFCKNQSECTFRVRFAQTFHIESRGWSDIAYNFLVGGDGYAYVGRGWDYVGAHAFNYNRKSIGISFIGTFNSEVPPKHQLHAAQELIKIGVQNGAIAADYKLLGHRQVSATLSPGDALFDVLKTWPHWSPTV